MFQTGASGTTPDRAATIRAGNLFKRANTSNLIDPYWQLADPSVGAAGMSGPMALHRRRHRVRRMILAHSRPSSAGRRGG